MLSKHQKLLDAFHADLQLRNYRPRLQPFRLSIPQTGEDHSSGALRRQNRSMATLGPA